MRIEMDQGNEQIDFGGAWQTLIFWICNFDFANPPMASRLQATAKSAGMHMAAAEAGDLGDFCTDFCIDFWRPFRPCRITSMAMCEQRLPALQVMREHRRASCRGTAPGAQTERHKNNDT